MLDKLPSVIERLFANANADPAVVAGCFTSDAVVMYDGMLFKGPASVEAWRQESRRRYPGMEIEPYEVVSFGDEVHVRMHLHGEFGGPRDRVCRFKLRGDLIERVDVL